MLCVPDPPILRVAVLLQPCLGSEEILENRPPSVRALTAALMQSAKKELTCGGESRRLSALASAEPACAEPNVCPHLRWPSEGKREKTENTKK